MTGIPWDRPVISIYLKQRQVDDGGGGEMDTGSRDILLGAYSDTSIIYHFFPGLKYQKISSLRTTTKRQQTTLKMRDRYNCWVTRWLNVRGKEGRGESKARELIDKPTTTRLNEDASRDPCTNPMVKSPSIGRPAPHIYHGSSGCGRCRIYAWKFDLLTQESAQRKGKQSGEWSCN